MGYDIRTTMALPILLWSVRTLLLCVSTLLFACGGGGGGSSNFVPASSQPASSVSSSVGPSSSILSSPGSSAVSSSTASSSMPSVITLTGKVTYDLVPHNDNQFGLNYSATTISAGRGLLIELLDSNNLILATTNSDNLGNYSFSVENNKLVKVRVKAQLLRTQSPAWNFKVTDNTSGNSLYAMDGSLVAASDTTAVRNLHAASGWTGTGYTQPRVAAPFAILETTPH
jgi:hypothetical protein